MIAGDARLQEQEVAVVHATNLPAGAGFVTSVDPQFRDPLGGDLHLGPGSPAVDYCDDALYTPLYRGGDHQPRGHDVASNANGSPGIIGGIYDIGYDEVHALFADGFENGNTSAWTTTVP